MQYMSRPYKEVNPGDPILAADWNAIQTQIRDHILAHTHTGTGESGAKLDITALAVGTDVAVRKLTATESLTIGSPSQPLLSVNPAALNQEGSYQVSVAGTLRADQVRTGRLDGITSLAVGALAVTGNLGIGVVTEPQARLDVNGDGKFSGPVMAAKLIGDPTSETLEIIGSGSAETNRKITLWAEGGATVQGGLTVRGALTTLNDGLAVTGGTDLRGAVTVGTTAAPQPLTVTGATVLNGALTVSGGKLQLDGNQQIRFTDGDTTNNLKLQLWSGYGLGINGGTLFYAAQGNHSWRDTNGTNERMLLTTGLDGGLTVKGTGTSSFAGNVGIGTATIDNPGGWNKVLDLWGTGHARLQVRSSGGVKTTVNSHDTWDGPLGVVGTETNHPLRLMTNNTHRMTILANGNVGIGFTLPDQKLTVSSATQHLQLRREATETTGGKLLFLELYQNDPQNRIPEVYPNIRFHHNNKFSHRIEARTDGFHLKNGDLGSDVYVSLRVDTITATRFVGEGAFVTGMIVMWSGAVNQIPIGWALCNGMNGTPDLRARFIVGAGPGGSPDYPPGQFGEADTHTHTIALPNTALNTTLAGSHNHAPPAEWYDRGALNGAAAAGLSWYNAIDRGGPSVAAVRTSTEGNHTHSVAVSIAAFNSSPSSGLNRPKWYALCFIMKL
jgi:hypothetical protein